MTLSQQVVVDTAQIENKEAYAPQITLEGSKVVVQVPSTWYTNHYYGKLHYLNALGILKQKMICILNCIHALYVLDF